MECSSLGECSAQMEMYTAELLYDTMTTLDQTGKYRKGFLKEDVHEMGAGRWTSCRSFMGALPPTQGSPVRKKGSQDCSGVSHHLQWM